MGIAPEQIPPERCPSCHEAFPWDNRAKIEAGTYKSNAPHFGCKNKSCDWRWWPEDKHGRPTQSPPSPVDKLPPPGGWEEAHALWGRACHEATKAAGDQAEDITPIAAAFMICAAIKKLPAVQGPSE